LVGFTQGTPLFLGTVYWEVACGMGSIVFRELCRNGKSGEPWAARSASFQDACGGFVRGPAQIHGVRMGAVFGILPGCVPESQRFKSFRLCGSKSRRGFRSSSLRLIRPAVSRCCWCPDKPVSRFHWMTPARRGSEAAGGSTPGTMPHT